MSLFFANKIFILHKIVNHNGYDDVDVYLTTTLSASYTDLPLGLSQRSWGLGTLLVEVVFLSSTTFSVLFLRLNMPSSGFEYKAGPLPSYGLLSTDIRIVMLYLKNNTHNNNTTTTTTTTTTTVA